MRYAVINAASNTWHYESGDLAEARRYRATLTAEGKATVLVEIIDDEDEHPTGAGRRDKARAALQAVIAAANANPEPIHHKVRTAIDAARKAL